MKRHLVGPLEELAEDEGRRVELDGIPVAVFRRGTRVFAVHDSCPHMGAALSEGFVNGGSVVCPWHGWTFDLETGASPLDPEECVEKYAAVVEDGQVFVEVPPSGGNPPASGSAPSPGDTAPAGGDPGDDR